MEFDTDSLGYFTCEAFNTGCINHNHSNNLWKND